MNEENKPVRHCSTCVCSGISEERVVIIIGGERRGLREGHEKLIERLVRLGEEIQEDRGESLRATIEQALLASPVGPVAPNPNKGKGERKRDASPFRRLGKG